MRVREGSVLRTEFLREDLRENKGGDGVARWSDVIVVVDLDEVDDVDECVSMLYLSLNVDEFECGFLRERQLIFFMWR